MIPRLSQFCAAPRGASPHQKARRDSTRAHARAQASKRAGESWIGELVPTPATCPLPHALTHTDTNIHICCLHQHTKPQTHVLATVSRVCMYTRETGSRSLCPTQRDRHTHTPNPWPPLLILSLPSLSMHTPTNVDLTCAHQYEGCTYAANPLEDLHDSPRLVDSRPHPP